MFSSNLRKMPPAEKAQRLRRVRTLLPFAFIVIMLILWLSPALDKETAKNVSIAFGAILLFQLVFLSFIIRGLERIAPKGDLT